MASLNASHLSAKKWRHYLLRTPALGRYCGTSCILTVYSVLTCTTCSNLSYVTSLSADTVQVKRQ